MSITIIKPRERVNKHEYYHEFAKTKWEGTMWERPAYAFLVNDEEEYIGDKEGLPNYLKCISHPNDWEDQGIRKVEWSYTENALAKCYCGKVIELYNEYQSACECPYCHRWYNLFGQELLNPKYWERDEEDY